MTPSGNPKHWPRLDSLRGIAALMVGGFHTLFSSGATPIGKALATALAYFFDGRTGVCIFFVLSGLVLGMSLRRSGALTPQNYIHFCVRRFFRLYPAYFISTFFYLALFLIVTTRISHGEPLERGWLDYDAGLTLTTTQIIQNFFFLSQSLNAVTWTLKVEVIAAFLLPFFHQYSRNVRWPGHAILLLALIILSFLPSSQPTRTCLYMFYCGYLIPLVVEKLHFHDFFRNDLLFWLAFIASMSAFIVSHLYVKNPEGFRYGAFWACLGSVILLCLMLSKSQHGIFNVLDHPVLRHLGTISYSFYLFNLLCLDFFLRFFRVLPSTSPLIHNYTFLGSILVFLCSTVACAAISTLTYHLVERPAIKLGARLCPQPAPSHSL